MRVPPFLEPGSVVRVVAASGAFDRERFERGLAVLRGAGLEPRFEDAIFVRQRYLAGSDAHRLAGLRAALDDPEARAIWTARGGYGATRIVGALERWPEKWLVGFSDTTALHAAASRAGWVSVHGANVTTLGEWERAHRDELFAMLRGDRSSLRFTGSAHGPRQRAQGILRGGNLTVLAAMVGTPELPRFDGAIVLLEDVGESPYRLDRVLTQMVRAGAFAGARGIALGQLTRCYPGEGADFTALDVVLECLEPLGLPVLSGLPLGHDSDSRGVWLEAPATIEGADLEVTLPVG